MISHTKSHSRRRVRVPQSSINVNFQLIFAAIAKKMGQNRPIINIIQIMRKTLRRDAAFLLFDPPLILSATGAKANVLPTHPVKKF